MRKPWRHRGSGVGESAHKRPQLRALFERIRGCPALGRSKAQALELLPGRRRAWSPALHEICCIIIISSVLEENLHPSTSPLQGRRATRSTLRSGRSMPFETHPAGRKHVEAESIAEKRRPRRPPAASSAAARGNCEVGFARVFGARPLSLLSPPPCVKTRSPPKPRAAPHFAARRQVSRGLLGQKRRRRRAHWHQACR